MTRRQPRPQQFSIPPATPRGEGGGWAAAPARRQPRLCARRVRGRRLSNRATPHAARCGEHRQCRRPHRHPPRRCALERARHTFVYSRVPLRLPLRSRSVPHRPLPNPETSTHPPSQTATPGRLASVLPPSAPLPEVREPCSAARQLPRAPPLTQPAFATLHPLSLPTQDCWAHHSTQAHPSAFFHGSGLTLMAARFALSFGPLSIGSLASQTRQPSTTGERASPTLRRRVRLQARKLFPLPVKYARPERPGQVVRDPILVSDLAEIRHCLKL